MFSPQHVHLIQSALTSFLRLIAALSVTEREHLFHFVSTADSKTFQQALESLHTVGAFPIPHETTNKATEQTGVEEPPTDSDTPGFLLDLNQPFTVFSTPLVHATCRQCGRPVHGITRPGDTRGRVWLFDETGQLHTHCHDKTRGRKGDKV